MTYANYLRLVIIQLKGRNLLDSDLFSGICDANYSTHHWVCCEAEEKHYRKLRRQIFEDLPVNSSWLDRNREWRWKHGNILPWCMITPRMRVNMRIRYLESLIRKEQ